MMRSIEESAAVFRKQFGKTEIEDDLRLRAVTLRPKSNSRMGSVMIVETPEGIVILGDNAPGHHGVISAFGYGFSWFSGKLEADYLCSKFLEKRYQPHLVRAYIKALPVEGRINEQDAQAALDRLSEQCSPDEAREVLDDIGENSGDLFIDGVFYDYDEGEAGRLIAIQERFAEAWNV